MQKRNVLNSPHLSELKRQRQKIFFKKILFFVFAFLALFFLFAYISRIDRLNINAIEVFGNNVIDTEMLKSTTEGELVGNYLWIFPKSNIFFYPKNHIKRTLSQKFKRLKNVSPSIKERRRLEISVTERDPKYTWCGTTPPESNNNKGICYFLDETGYIFDEAPYFSGEVYFKFYGLTQVITTEGLTPPNTDNPSGSYFSPDIFIKLIFFKETLENLKLKPVALYIQENGYIKMYLSGATSSIDPEIILKKDADFQKIIENLEVALTTEPLQTDFKKKYSSLLYIDLRFGNKVYYKFR